MQIRRSLLLASGLLMAAHFYVGAARPILLPWIQLPSLPGGVTGSTLVFVLFSLAHAVYALGWRHTALLFTLAVGISWALEEVGVTTGLIYGGYHYTDFLGPKLGHVPLLIPLSWFMMIYPSYIVANCLVLERSIGTPGGAAWAAWLSFLTAAVMTGRDLIIDPNLSGPVVNAWVWEEAGEYFGVPVLNYAGWMLTAFLVVLPYRLLERRIPPVPLGPIGRGVATMPIIMHAVLIVSGIVGSHVAALRVIGPFVVGLPALVALTRVWLKPDGYPTPVD